MRTALTASCIFCVIALGLTTASFGAQPETTSAPSEDAPRLYAVEIRTGPGWDQAKPPQEQAFFREHSATLKRLRDAGHIRLGARYSDIGLLIFSSTSASDVDDLMRADPSIDAGTFVYSVHDFNVFYPGMIEAPPKP
jgi:hypothetical protein